MKKILLSSFVVGTFVFYAFYNKHEASEGTDAVALVQKSTQQTSEPVQTQSTTPQTTQTPSGKYKDGEYTGNRADAFYGYIQVKAVITGGRITDVVFLEAPNDRDTSILINKQATVFLKQEAIAAQSSEVNIVTGATDTSFAFRESLKDALNQAS